MPITTTPDHVAVAVPSIERAAERWHDELGAGWLGEDMERLSTPVGIRQMQFSNGGKLELLQPTGDGFAQAFVDRFGPRIHHVTLKVPDALLPAVETVREAGYDVVDVNTDGTDWHESFLRPSQAGGLIVQIAWQRKSDDEWFAETGYTPEPPRGSAALLGPTLTHPDLDAADHLWTTLGGKITREDEVLTVRWDGSPLDIRIEAGPTAGPVGLRFAGTEALPAHDAAGPAVLVA